MKLIPKILICSISFIAACGSDEKTSNAAPPAEITIDGALVPLVQSEENYLPPSTNSGGLQTVVAPITQKFTASTTHQLHLESTVDVPCNINVYSQYESQESTFRPQADSRIMQINSAICGYTGPIYILNHHKTLLVEVIDLLQTDVTVYYEIDITDNKVSLTMN
jgi:hypothetical protein